MNHHQEAVLTEPYVNFAQRGRQQSPHETTIASLFATICERHREDVALTLGDRSMTFAELDRVANGIPAHLVQHGAGRGSIVAICLERSLEMIAAALATLKCGAAYLPLDACYPAARLAETVADAAPISVITTSSMAHCFKATVAVVLCLDELDLQEGAVVTAAIFYD